MDDPRRPARIVIIDMVADGRLERRHGTAPRVLDGSTGARAVFRYGSLMGTWHRFRDRAQRDDDVAVAVCGAGYLGRALVTQFTRAEGMHPAIVVNRTVRRAVDAYALAGVDAGRVLVSDDPEKLSDAVAEARPAVSPDAAVLPELPGVGVVVEATGAMSYGAETILAVLDAGKDVVSMNAEVEAVIGPLLHRVARQRGVVYTPGDGDQPGAMLRLIELVESFGLQVGAAINCKGNLDLHQNPDDSRPYAERDNVSVQQTTSWGDGTKMQVENAVVANIAGLVPDVRGMHGVRTTVANAGRDIGAALSRRGCVEYTVGGDFGGGVAVLASDPLGSPLVEASLRLNKLGDGPDYFLFRPFHIAALEVPPSRSPRSCWIGPRSGRRPRAMSSTSWRWPSETYRLGSSSTRSEASPVTGSWTMPRRRGICCPSACRRMLARSSQWPLTSLSPWTRSNSTVTRQWSASGAGSRLSWRQCPAESDTAACRHTGVGIRPATQRRVSSSCPSASIRVIQGSRLKTLEYCSAGIPWRR